MRKQNHTDFEDRESFSPWQSYSDLYCGLLLVFALLFFFAIYQYISAREINQASTQALQASMEAEQAAVLANFRADTQNQDEELNRKIRELDDQQALLANTRADLENQVETLQAREAQLKEQDDLLKAQQELLEEQAVTMENLLGLRRRLIETLSRRMEENNLVAEMDRETGAIRFPSELLFDLNAYELKKEGKDFLKRFMPLYLDVLMDPEFADSVAEIIIEGHTDQRGEYWANLRLSQNRAFSVANYCVKDAPQSGLSESQAAYLQKMMTVNGCADNRPIYQEGAIDQDASRRVEIKFRLKDQEMIQEMDEILRQS